ncbi:MAG: hypothetical protein AAB401_19390 [Acidobacteriota bacterium]
MEATKVYEEVINFIAAGTTPESVAAFHPSEKAQERVEDLVFRSKTTGLTPEEEVELNHYVEIEHMMRMAKARAHQFLKS